MFKDKVVVITGGASGIGKCIKEEFIKDGALVEIIDIKEGQHFVGDIADKDTLIAFKDYIINKYGHIDYLINNAIPLMKGIDDCTYEEFEYVLKVGTIAPFYLTKLFKPYFNKDAAIINISSTKDKMSQAQSESYAAAKGGLSALTHAMSMSLRHKVRVNAISPGWIDNINSELSLEDNYQHPSARVGKPIDIANMVLFLCSDKASFINGENIYIDGGMSKQMIYHNDDGWTYRYYD